MKDYSAQPKPKRQPDFPWMIRSPARTLALGFGSGLAPIVPGTFGTLVALPFIFIFAQGPMWFYIAGMVGVSAIGVWACETACNDMGAHDDRSIVWDEVAGYLITMFLLPLTWQWLLAGFVLFRLVDIIKPWPINLLDKHVDGGFGVMIDDIAAGVLCCIVLHIVNYAIFI